MTGAALTALAGPPAHSARGSAPPATGVRKTFSRPRAARMIDGFPAEGIRRSPCPSTEA